MTAVRIEPQPESYQSTLATSWPLAPTQAGRCEQLVQSCYLVVHWPGIEFFVMRLLFCVMQWPRNVRIQKSGRVSCEPAYINHVTHSTCCHVVQNNNHHRVAFDGRAIWSIFTSLERWIDRQTDGRTDRQSECILSSGRSIWKSSTSNVNVVIRHPRPPVISYLINYLLFVSLTTVL